MADPYCDALSDVPIEIKYFLCIQTGKKASKHNQHGQFLTHKTSLARNVHIFSELVWG